MAKASASSGVGGILSDFASKYDKSTPKKIKLIDGFLAYVLATGILQFIYCALVGTFPFNSFLSGFVCTVGVFVLAGSCARCIVQAMLALALLTSVCLSAPLSVAANADRPRQRVQGPYGAARLRGLSVLQPHSLPGRVQLHGLSGLVSMAEARSLTPEAVCLSRQKRRNPSALAAETGFDEGVKHAEF